jgi:8-oxo-dGTP pyrophosphatase MutT (NUDIX family)
MWDTPGGFIDPGEDGEQAALRELLEETGLAARITSFLGAWPDGYGTTGASTINLFWTAVVDDPTVAAAASDVAELAWFAPADLPDAGEVAFTCVPQVLARWRDATLAAH